MPHYYAFTGCLQSNSKLLFVTQNIETPQNADYIDAFARWGAGKPPYTRSTMAIDVFSSGIVKSYGSINRKCFAGLPITTSCLATSLITTEPAPTKAPSPILFTLPEGMVTP